MADGSVTECWGMFEQEIWDNPYPMYAAVRGQGGHVQPVTLADGRHAWLVTGYETVRRALGDPRLSRDIEGYRDRWPERPPMYPPILSKRHMLNADPPDHDRLRGLVNRVFTPRRVEALRPRVQEITDELLEAMPTHGKVDLIDALAFPLPIRVIYELLGVETDGSDELRSMITGLISNAYLPSGQDAAREALARLDTYLAGLLENKRRHPGDDLLSALIATRDEAGARLDEAELAGFVFLLVIAGHETTLNLICNAVVALLQAPDQLERLRREPELITKAVSEFLRFDSPVHQATMRAALVDLELEGVAIPAGGLVLMNLASANHDPDHFTDPDRLDVGRQEASHVGFGHGIHYCLGASLAMQETEVAIASLLRRYPSIQLAVPATDLHWRQSMVIRGIEALPLEVSTAAVI